MSDYAMKCLVCKKPIVVQLADGANVIECTHCGSVFELEIEGLAEAIPKWHPLLEDNAVLLSDVLKSEFIVKVGATQAPPSEDTDVEAASEEACGCREYDPRANDSPLRGFDDRLCDISRKLQELAEETDCLRDMIFEYLFVEEEE